MKKRFTLLFALILIIVAPVFADKAGYYINYYNFDAVLHENNDMVFTGPYLYIITLPIMKIKTAVK